MGDDAPPGPLEWSFLSAAVARLAHRSGDLAIPRRLSPDLATKVATDSPSRQSCGWLGSLRLMS
jgi:hypothetical protein